MRPQASSACGLELLGYRGLKVVVDVGLRYVWSGARVRCEVSRAVAHLSPARHTTELIYAILVKYQRAPVRLR